MEDAATKSECENGVDLQTESPQTPHRKVTGFKWFLVCLGIFSANILYGLDTTIAADIQAPVVATFNDVTRVGWLGVGFSLGSVATILPIGKAYGSFDTKWVFIGSMLMFAAGSALCGAAPTMTALIIGRVWAGAGGAGMYLGNLNMITLTTTPSEQPLYIGLVGLIYGTGAILGPIVGGTLADSSATWRMAFYLNLFIFALMSPIYLFILPSIPQQPEKSRWMKIKNLDGLGTFLSIVMYVTFTVAFTLGGSTWRWNDPGAIVLIVIFVVSLLAFSVTQYYKIWTTEEARLFPLEFLRSKSLVLLYICMAAGGSCIFVSIYYVPLYFQFVYGDNGTQAAIRLLPLVCFFVATVLICGAAMPKTGYYMVWYLASGIMITIGAALMYTVRVETDAAKIYGFTIIFGLGLATSQAGYAIGPTLVKPERVTEVIQFFNIAQGQSQLLGLTIASAVFQSRSLSGLRKVFEGTSFSEEQIRGAIAGSQSQVLEMTTPALRQKALEVIVQSIDEVYILAIAGGATYVVCSCFLKREK